MIALAQQLRRSPSGLGRSVLLLIALTAALIVGLLAMHALGAPTANAEPAAAVSVQEAGAAHGHDAPPADGICPDCGGHEAMLAMTCVVALLIVSLLFLVPRAGVSWGVVFGRAGPLMVAGRVAVSRPPSLLVLCISRT
ncbi:DUF6153 family protein [Microbacterium sp. LRZ72]|uniref:DUF6153 family protein n=1 Tax=Microbacterium sp. LRZ72 TaxID=2942481 RepID=UPI0029BA8ED6|nr:DUF6153 family protein [Microbacterium sp. LRZ72]MDX2377573.1 DUF6153 family protein [Microbacterium sp. LRZ72]